MYNLFSCCYLKLEEMLRRFETTICSKVVQI